jgi:hypothetical protein
MSNVNFGIEKEYFLKKLNEETNQWELCVIPKYLLPYDNCGVLVEARSKKSTTIREAVFSLMEEEYRIKEICKTNDLRLIETNAETITPVLKRETERIFTKGLVEYMNLYHYLSHKTKKNEVFAGLHIHINIFENSWEKELIKNKGRIIDAKDVRREVNVLFDFPSFIKYMDKNFEQEIKDTRRGPGFYEIKSDGRVEYRSLPAQVDLMKVIDVVQKYKF